MVQTFRGKAALTTCRRWWKLLLSLHVSSSSLPDWHGGHQTAARSSFYLQAKWTLSIEAAKVPTGFEDFRQRMKIKTKWGSCGELSQKAKLWIYWSVYILDFPCGSGLKLHSSRARVLKHWGVSFVLHIWIKGWNCLTSMRSSTTEFCSWANTGAMLAEAERHLVVAGNWALRSIVWDYCPMSIEYGL